MSSTATASISESYTFADIENVVRRFTADLKMIANSTGAESEEWAADVAYDVELFAKKGFLKSVDVMQFSYGREVRAVHYDVNVAAGGLTANRPGGVRWDSLPNQELRIILTYSEAGTTSHRESVKQHLRRNWFPTLEDTSHASLRMAGGRDYVSGAFGFQRKDYTQ